MPFFMSSTCHDRGSRVSHGRGQERKRVEECEACAQSCADLALEFADPALECRELLCGGQRCGAGSLEAVYCLLLSGHRLEAQAWVGRKHAKVGVARRARLVARRNVDRVTGRTEVGGARVVQVRLEEPCVHGTCSR